MEIYIGLNVTPPYLIPGARHHRTAGIINENVHLAEIREHVPGKSRRLRFISKIRLEYFSFSSQGSNLGANYIRLFLMVIEMYRNIGAGTRQSERNRTADSSAGTGDQGCFSSEVHRTTLIHEF